MRQLIKNKTVQWMDITSMNHKDSDFLQKTFKFHPLDIKDCMSETRFPKLNEYNRYLFVILQFPIWDFKKHRIIIQEAEFFLGKNFLVSVHDHRLSKISDLFSKISSQKDKKQTTNFFANGPGHILYQILSALFSDLPQILDILTKKSQEIERAIFSKSSRKDILTDIMKLRREIIVLHRILSPERLVISSLGTKHQKYIKKDLSVYFDNVLDSVDRTFSIIEAFKDTSDNLQNTNESLISHQTNNIIKVLTIFSVIMLPLTFITGFYGMNIPLPFAAHPYSLNIVIGFLLCSIILMLSIFKFKKWL